METQLKDRYLKQNRITNGLYLVGWFYCKLWELPPAKLSNIKKACDTFEKQAFDLSDDQYEIKAFVLDCSL